MKIYERMLETFDDGGVSYLMAKGIYNGFWAISSS